MSLPSQNLQLGISSVVPLIDVPEVLTRQDVLKSNGSCRYEMIDLLSLSELLEAAWWEGMDLLSWVCQLRDTIERRSSRVQLKSAIFAERKFRHKSYPRAASLASVCSWLWKYSRRKTQCKWPTPLSEIEVYFFRRNSSKKLHIRSRALHTSARAFRQFFGLPGDGNAAA